MLDKPRISTCVIKERTFLRRRTQLSEMQLIDEEIRRFVRTGCLSASNECSALLTGLSEDTGLRSLKGSWTGKARQVCCI